ncbi:MAG: 50S ribosomal protein L3 [Candidatus Omnitrophota bacterium]|nr:50S ribosomal protein L3 [Candidatus Omnitrophota bacterium]
MIGLLGRKIGMTHKFGEDGKFIPVSVLEVGPCFVLQSKDKSLQLAFGKANPKRVKRPLIGLFKKAGVEPQVFIKEVKIDNAKDYKPGQELKVDVFKEGDFVDVTGVSIGKGFCGGMKRWHWAGGPKTHGHTSHRRVGSIGSSTTPGRVFKGKHMPGHMGHKTVTTQNLKVVKIDNQNNVLAVKGAVAGPKNGYLIIRKAKKKK